MWASSLYLNIVHLQTSGEMRYPHQYSLHLQIWGMRYIVLFQIYKCGEWDISQYCKSTNVGIEISSSIIVNLQMWGMRYTSQYSKSTNAKEWDISQYCKSTNVGNETYRNIVNLQMWGMRLYHKIITPPLWGMRYIAIIARYPPMWGLRYIIVL